MGLYTSGNSVDITKLRPSARKRRLVKDYDKGLLTEDTISLEDKTSFSREKTDLEEEIEVLSKETKEEYDKHFKFKKKEEDFVDKHADNFIAREKYFKKRIEEEKWGDLKVQDVVDKLFELGTILTDVNLYPYQVKLVKRIFLSVLLNDAAEIVSIYSRQSGKSTSFAFAMVTLCTFIPQLANFFTQIEHLKKGIKVGVFAGNNLQVDNLMDMVDTFIGSERAKEIFRDPDVRVQVTKRKWSNGSEIFAQSAAKQTRIESKSFQLIFIDECQDIDDEKITRSIHPMAAHWAGSIIKSGTPIPKICELYRASNRGKRKDIDRAKYMQTTFLVDYVEVQKHNKKYKHYIQLEKERLGEESPSFRMAYAIEWLVEKGMVISPDIFETKLCLPNQSFEEYHDGLCVAGLDLGKDMHSTVCTIIHLKPATLIRDGFEDVVLEHHILNWLEISHIDWDQQISTIKDFLKRYKGLKAVAFDATGIGNAVFDLMKNYFRDIGVKPVPYKFNTKLKAQMAENFDTLLHSNLIKIPASSLSRRTKKWQKFFVQMTECEREYKNGMTVFQKPNEPDAHDDYVDSLLLGLHAAQNKLLRTAQGSQISIFTNSTARVERGKLTSFEALRKSARNRSRANMVQSLMDKIKK